MLHTKKDFIDCLNDIINPVKEYYTDGKAGVVLGSTGVQYGEKIALFEGFARILWGIAPLWCGGNDIDGFNKIYLEGIVNGTNPSHDEFWGEMTNYSQKIVEVAAIGYGLILAPEKLWNPLSDEQKKNFSKWLYKINEVECPNNNWNFFIILTNLGLKNVGEKYSESNMKSAICKINQMYKGNGWYSDGMTEQMDYYIAFAMHFYGLIYAKVMEKEDPVNSELFKERAMKFAEDFIYWFDENGSSVAFGRSLTYRFAQCCFWSACVYAGIKPFDMGIMKGLIARNIEYWLNCDIFDNGGILSVGYEYPNLIMSEGYNSSSSPYWALKAFLILALEDDHEFFKVEAQPLPELEKLRIIKEAKMVIQRHCGYPIMLTGGQWVKFEMSYIAERYSKFAYSSRYSFCVSRENTALRSVSTDSMLIFEINDQYYMRRKCEETDILDDGTLYSKWSPFPGVTVKSYITPIDGGHKRKHIISSLGDYTVFDGAFATPDNSGNIEGDGEETTIMCCPNINLSNNLTTVKAIKYNIKKGENIIETTAWYPKSC